jgi:uncharacterized protein GlcG (DUF336 family)
MLSRADPVFAAIAAFKWWRSAEARLAERLAKHVSVAVLDSFEVTIVLIRGGNVGPHNTEASRRKAYTALSIHMPSFELMKNAAADPTAQNLNSLPELLLGGGVPIWKDGVLVGSTGVSGAGGGQNDHDVAQRAVEALGFPIRKQQPSCARGARPGSNTSVSRRSTNLTTRHWASAASGLRRPDSSTVDRTREPSCGETAARTR